MWLAQLTPPWGREALQLMPPSPFNPMTPCHVNTAKILSCSNLGCVKHLAWLLGFLPWLAVHPVMHTSSLHILFKVSLSSSQTITNLSSFIGPKNPLGSTPRRGQRNDHYAIPKAAIKSFHSTFCGLEKCSPNCRQVDNMRKITQH